MSDTADKVLAKLRTMLSSDGTLYKDVKAILSTAPELQSAQPPNATLRVLSSARDRMNDWLKSMPKVWYGNAAMEQAINAMGTATILIHSYERTSALPAAEINALPEHVRKYIMWLETDADPAGTIVENFRLTEENAALRKLLATPGAEWREWSAIDPHGQRYNCERAQLPMGDLTDDELANAVYHHGDRKPSFDDIRSGKAMLPIAYLTAAKERIRWLSRALDFELKKDRP